MLLDEHIFVQCQRCGANDTCCSEVEELTCCPRRRQQRQLHPACLVRIGDLCLILFRFHLPV